MQLDLDTAFGPARATLKTVEQAAALVVLGHGAGGGIEAPDLVAVSRELTAAGVAVARVEQPYRVAGRRAPAPAHQLDSAFSSAVLRVREEAGLAGVPLITGGRSSGARVACRTAGVLNATAVVALAFPLHPPGRPDRSRVDELVSAGVPVLVVQGEQDAFGRPGEFPPGTRLAAIPGADHGFRRGAREAALVVANYVLAQVRESRLANRR